MLLSLLQEQRAGLSGIPMGSDPRHSLALPAVFNGLGYKNLGCWEPPLWLVKASPNNELQTGPCGFPALLPKRVIAHKTPSWKLQRSQGEAMKALEMFNKKASTLDSFPKEYLIFVALGCLERRKITGPLTTAPWPVLPDLKQCTRNWQLRQPETFVLPRIICNTL